MGLALMLGATNKQAYDLASWIMDYPGETAQRRVVEMGLVKERPFVQKATKMWFAELKKRAEAVVEKELVE